MTPADEAYGNVYSAIPPHPDDIGVKVQPGMMFSIIDPDPDDFKETFTPEQYQRLRYPVNAIRPDEV